MIITHIIYMYVLPFLNKIYYDNTFECRTNENILQYKIVPMLKYLSGEK